MIMAVLQGGAWADGREQNSVCGTWKDGAAQHMWDATVWGMPLGSEYDDVWASAREAYSSDQAGNTGHARLRVYVPLVATSFETTYSTTRLLACVTTWLSTSW